MIANKYPIKKVIFSHLNQSKKEIIPINFEFLKDPKPCWLAQQKCEANDLLNGGSA